MKNRMRFPLIPKLTLVNPDIKDLSIEYIEIDLINLIDDYLYVRDLLEKHEPKEQLDYSVLIQISEWLFECYKKIKHPIMSNRILDSFRCAITMANNKRDLC